MTKKLPQTLEIGVTEVRKKLGRLINSVKSGEEHVVVSKLGKPVAAIISIEDYEKLRRRKAQKKHRELGRLVGAKASDLGLTKKEKIK